MGVHVLGADIVAPTVSGGFNHGRGGSISRSAPNRVQVVIVNEVRLQIRLKLRHFGADWSGACDDFRKIRRKIGIGNGIRSADGQRQNQHQHQGQQEFFLQVTSPHQDITGVEYGLSLPKAYFGKLSFFSPADGRERDRRSAVGQESEI